MPDFTYAYPRPALTVDALMLKYSKSILELLLIKRKDEPFRDCWAFPGGFVEENETVEEALKRELGEETGLEVNDPVEFYTASAPGRDPRGWTVSVVFMDVIHRAPELVAGDDAAEARWHSVTDLPPLAFDHEDIINRAIECLRDFGMGGKFVKRFLPETFSEEQLLTLYRQLFSSDTEANKEIERIKAHHLILSVDSAGLFRFNSAC